MLEADKVERDMNNGWGRDGRTDRYAMEEKINEFPMYIKFN